ncbi:MAG: hypothetical protein B6U86_03150 [Candidatus Altiarchaeales archaeon ex4484_43]|nr:MAG: hypothetical protein B6U86_03150 [Candidatus Altiarchaeales archaeon ex4484_43]
MKLSVIIPTLNEEKYIEKTLRHLKEQEERIEVIIVDGNSSDSTVDVAENLADKVVVIDESNVSKQRNIGARASKGKILAFIDADTLVPKNYATRVLEELKNEEFSGCFCKFYPLSEKLRHRISFNMWRNVMKASLLLNKPYITGSCAPAFKRDAFFSVGGYDENLHIIEDGDLSMRIHRIGKIIYLNDVIAKTSTRRLDKVGYLRFIGFWLPPTIKYWLGLNVSEKLDTIR